MDIRVCVVDPRGAAQPVDVLLQSPEDATLDDIRGALLSAAGSSSPGRRGGPQVPLYVDGEEVAGCTLVGRPPLLEGVVVSIGEPGMTPPRRIPGVLELHVVGGPDSGQIFRLPPGAHRLGRAAEATIRLADRDLSRVHAQVTVDADGVFVADLGSTNGTLLDGEPLGEGARPLTTANRLRVGSSTLLLRVPGGAPAATAPDCSGHLDVNRSPRILPPVEPVEVRLPARPVRRDGPRIPVVALVLPLLVAVPVALLQHSAIYLLFGVMSPLMMLGNVLGDHRHGRRSHRAAVADYEAARAGTEAQVTAALLEEGRRRRAQLPDHAELLLTATTPLARLWERRRRDADVLLLRVGTRDLTSRVTVVDPDAEGARSCPDVLDVPVGVPLAEVGVLGVAGPREQTVGLVRAMLAQVCCWHSPRDVSLVVLCAEERLATCWSWTAYVPHTLPTDGATCHNLLGVLSPAGDQVQRRVAELSALVADRRAGRHGTGTPAWTGPRTVVLLDGVQRLRAVPGVPQLLEDGPEVGLSFVCLDSEAARLPVEAHGTVEVGVGVTTTLRVSLTGRAPLDDVVADLVGAGWAERLARSLAPLRDATPEEDSGELPDTARLLDLLPFDATDPAQVGEQWRARRRCTVALLGVAAQGPYAVDLRREGPHALVGGTTGSGKSELLQTIIASLALANAPDEMSFVLVDYKGGSAFKDCARLPHTVGLVTDLDGHLAERALASLNAELSRRERQLRSLGVKDIEEYQAAAGPTDPPLPRLVLVIDEFRMLADELPSFLDGLVRIASVGRSLGVHLLLATQRPAGIVSADIKANVNLRIALRMRDRSDSEDVIEAPDAADVSERTPGRALLRSAAHPPVRFQSARVGGHAGDAAPRDVHASVLSGSALGDPPPREVANLRRSGPTDLARIVDATTSAASELAVPPVASPWLPPLPEVVTLEDLAGDDSPWRTFAVPYARLDLPDQQRQTPLTWDLERDGHLAVAGAARSGRTTLLRTIAGSMAQRFSADDVHLYAFDGAGGLAPLSRLPHTGAVVPRDEVGRADRLVARLLAEIAQRQDLLGRHGYSSIVEQRQHADTSGQRPLPFLVLLVDGWDQLSQAFESVDHGRPAEQLLQVLRDGAAVGLRAVVAGDRSVLLSRVASVTPEKLVLRLTDPADLALAGLPVRAAPRHMPPGRAVRTTDGAVLQVALLTPDASGPAQVAALTTLGAASHARHSPERMPNQPFRVDPLPRRVRASRLSLPPPGPDLSPSWALVGVAGDELTPVGIDPVVEGGGLLVAGPPGSGRSTALATMALHLAAAGRPVAVVMPRRSPLQHLAEHPGVVAVLCPDDREPLVSLRKELPDLAVFVDDAELALDTPCEDVLVEIARSSDTTGGSVVCAGSSSELVALFRGITVEVRRRRVGVLLNPSGYSDGELFGVRTARAPEILPGRGLLVRAGRVVPVQVATPD